MKISISIALLLITISLSQQTPLEKKDYSNLTTYDELISFVNELDQSSDLLNVEVLGKSVEHKIKILIFAQQHGNEQSGKEGALMLARDLLKTENEYLFDKIDFALVPQMNPGGAEKKKTRIGNVMDLNRNHLILTEPETI